MRFDQHQRLLEEAVKKEREKAKATLDAMSRMTTTFRLLEAAMRLIVKHDLISEYIQEVSLMDTTNDRT